MYSEISGKRVHPGPEHLSIYLSIDLVHGRRHHACITSGEGTQKKGCVHFSTKGVSYSGTVPVWTLPYITYVRHLDSLG